jgi:hypothetical protein
LHSDVGVVRADGEGVVAAELSVPVSAKTMPNDEAPPKLFQARKLMHRSCTVLVLLRFYSRSSALAVDSPEERYPTRKHTHEHPQTCLDVFPNVFPNSRDFGLDPA